MAENAEKKCKIHSSVSWKQVRRTKCHKFSDTFYFEFLVDELIVT